MEEEKTLAQLKEEAEAEKWRRTVIDGQGSFFDEREEVVYPPKVVFLWGTRWIDKDAA